MVAEVQSPSAFLVKIVRYIPQDFIPLNAICFAARLLEGGVLITNVVLTCILSKHCAP